MADEYGEVDKQRRKTQIAFLEKAAEIASLPDMAADKQKELETLSRAYITMFNQETF